MTIESPLVDFRSPSKYDQFDFSSDLVTRGWDEIEIGYEYTDYPKWSMVLSDDVVNQFAAMTGDFNPIHTDHEFARRSIHRKRIVHGALLMSICIGRYHGSGFSYGTTLALLENRSTFVRACPVGEEVYANFVVVDKEENPHPKRGLVHYRAWLRSVEDHDPFVEIEFRVLVRRLRGKSALRRLGIEVLPQEKQ